MDSIIDNDWLTIKHDPVDESQVVGNVSRSWQWRELGMNPSHYPASKTVLENAAEDILVQKPLKIRSCDLPGYPRSTFLMVFSPDGTKVASTHGNHNVYVSDLASGKHIKILEGHPRTPWCIAFHPSHTQLIGSGCLGGQVRVWDMGSGGSEVWNVRYETVIASIAFHPREQLLVIATYNELYFWDWSHPAPFTKVTTNNINEKVRYVAFDSLGYKLITGISVSGCPTMSGSSLLQQHPVTGTSNTQSNNSNRRNASGNANENPPSTNPATENAGSAQDMIVNSYQNLVQRYDSLVRNYQRLFMVRHRLSNSSQPPPNRIDRGTDPMETDTSPSTSGVTRNTPPSTNTPNTDDGPSTSSTSHQENTESGEGESSSRLLNLDALTFDSEQSRTQDSGTDRTAFGSRSSAFQPLNETGRSFRPSEQNDRSTRLLPNPFSSPGGISRSARFNFGERFTSGDSDPTNASRTSIYTSPRMSTTASRVFITHRRNFSPIRRGRISLWSDAPWTENNPANSPRNVSNSSSTNEEARTAAAARRPTMTNSSTQMSPVPPPLDAEALNESLDLIRDILRDSGTRLLNLITDMSLSMMSTLERERRRRTHSEDGASGDRPPRPRPRPRPHLLSVGWRRELLSSSSDSDSDHSLEPDALRARSAGFRDSVDAAAHSATSLLTNLPTDRLVYDMLNDRNENTSHDVEGIDILRSDGGVDSPSQNAEHLTQTPEATTSTAAEPGPSCSNEQPSSSRTHPSPPFSRPSTSRDDFWTRDSPVSSEEAFQKVKSGVIALQKHTVRLANMWFQGNRISMRLVRTLWENLRRRILTLQREIGRQDSPGYYTRSLLERCMMLTDITEPISRPSNRNLRRSMETNRNNERNSIPSNEPHENDNNDPNRDNPEDILNLDSLRDTLQARPGRTAQARPHHPGARMSTSGRRTLQEELRRRSRNIASNRLSQRYSNRSRREITRAIEISATKHEVRMRAMQVLSVMFNMMMMCLEERGLSQLIILMLRTLKKALLLSWFMVMSHRSTTRSDNTQAQPSQRTEAMDVVHIQNEDDANPVNVDDPDDTQVTENVHSTNHVVVENTQTNEQNRVQESQETTKLPCPEPRPETVPDQPDQTRLPVFRTPRWSNRLAVQIAAANRNNSATALSRRELYLESRRLKALHRTNPSIHPLNKKRTGPPMSTYRIPSLRCFPRRSNFTRSNTTRTQETNANPIPGPSHMLHPENPIPEPPRSEDAYEFYQRVNFIRIAQMQAVRLRNAARNRFRRLQTIRLYTPSSVREMFALHSNNPENPPEGRSPLQNNPELSSRRQFAVYRPHILAQRIDPTNGSEEPLTFNSVPNNTAAPPAPNQPQNAQNERDGQSGPTQRLPRIHEYLQPIILAQNAMVVEEEGGGARRLGGMAGLLDAGIISETMPASSHRVQAWDFTTGNVPEIADGKKNVVVQKCRIHNDASIDISKDGRVLVALLPAPRMRNTNHWLGVYSLEWGRLGQCLHTAALEQTAVSVALSPTARHLAVGLGSKRFTSTHRAHNPIFALLYKLDSPESTSRTGLSPIKELEQNWEQGFTSLNCLRWAPQPGQGLVYANNAGQLIVMS